MKYPKAESLKATVQDGPLLTVRKSLWSLMPLFLVFAAMLVGIWKLTKFMMSTTLFGEGVLAAYISPRMLGIFPALVLLEAVRRYFNDLYVLDTDKVIHYSGRLSLQYAVPVIRYADIRGINVSQGLIGRIFDYGNVEIGTAASEGEELVLHSVASPEELASLVDDLRTKDEEDDTSSEQSEGSTRSAGD